MPVLAHPVYEHVLADSLLPSEDLRVGLEPVEYVVEDIEVLALGRIAPDFVHIDDEQFILDDIVPKLAAPDGHQHESVIMALILEPVECIPQGHLGAVALLNIAGLLEDGFVAHIHYDGIVYVGGDGSNVSALRIVHQVG